MVSRMRIRAAVLEEFGQPLVVQEVELAEPKKGEVLVRLVACGVCHTDLYTASGADPSGYSPTVLGHEGAGVVERVGDGVTDVAPGDHVVTLFSPQCRECEHCRDHRTNLCLAIREQQNQGHLPDGTTRLSRDGEPVRQIDRKSTRLNSSHGSISYAVFCLKKKKKKLTIQIKIAVKTHTTHIRSQH